jgi:hypothetical protein
MKYIKIYEHFENKPKVGDYVIVFNDNFRQKLKDFLNSNIGKIIKIDDPHEKTFNYTVEFEKEINKITNRFEKFAEDEIIEWSSDKELLKIKKEINKYNL